MRTKIGVRLRARRAVGVASALLVALTGGTGRAQAPLGPAKMDSPVSMEQGAGFLLFDLTQKDDKTNPVIRLGYQSFVGDALRRMRQRNPEADIHGVPYFSVNLTGVPSGDVASIFSDGNVSTGAEVQLSFGQAYLLSYATPRDISVTEANLAALIGLANAIERRKAAITAEAAKEDPDTAKIKAQRDTIDLLATSAGRRKAALQQKMNTTDSQLFKEVFRTGIVYADQVIAYARSDVLAKPTAPDPLTALGQRGGAVYDAWFARLGVSAGSATFFDASKPFAEQFHREDYRGYSVQVGYSIRVGGRLPYIVAFSGGMKRSNNVDELNSVEVTETQNFISPDGVTKRGTSRKRNGLVGIFEQETNPLAKLDLVFYPDLAAASRDRENLRSTIALDIFTRAERGARTVFGIGAYVTKPGSPTSVYGGVNAYRAENGKLAIDLVAGFPF
jgi:hypothetical protein